VLAWSVEIQQLFRVVSDAAEIIRGRAINLDGGEMPY
jgi:hypothetical protein